MSHDSLREQVTRILKTEWPAFAERHPHLAQVLDETLLADHVARSIGDDSEYQRAMHRAAAVGQSAEVVAEVLSRLVRRVLDGLV